MDDKIYLSELLAAAERDSAEATGEWTPDFETAGMCGGKGGGGGAPDTAPNA